MIRASFARPFALFALAAGLAAFALALFAPAILNDGDTYWHIRAGEWMLAHHTVLHADPFSYTVAGAPWHTAEWLSEILMALAFDAGGWSGIHLLFAAAGFVTAAVVAGEMRRQADFVPATLAAVLGLCCIAGSLLARPHVLSLPLLALWCAGLVRARAADRAPDFRLLVLMPLWANLHGSFAFGIALACALGFEAVAESPGRRIAAARRWGVFILAATATACLTPEGVHGLAFPFALNAMASLAHIGEWQPSSFDHLTPFAIALLASLAVLARGRVTVPVLRLAILIGLVWLALAHARHQMLLGVAGPLLLAPSLGRAWPPAGATARRWAAPLILTALVLLALLRFALPARHPADPGTPAAAMAHVPRFVRETPVLNDYRFGGYLIWLGVKPFIDSRADLYGDAFLENYAAITEPDRDALVSSLAYYHARWTIFAANAPVVKLMDAMPGWHRLYGDTVAVVHVKD